MSRFTLGFSRLRRKYGILTAFSGMVLVIWFIGWVIFSFLVEKNDPMHFRVIVHRGTGKLTVKKDSGHFFRWINAIYPYEWANAVWFSKYREEGAVKDESIPLRYNDAARGSISGIMVYKFREETPESFLTDLHQNFRDQENFEDRVIRVLNADALKLSAAAMSSEQSYTTRKQEFGLMALDQLQNGIYQTEVVRETVVDFTGDEVETDVIKIVRAENGEPIRIDEKSLGNQWIDIIVHSLYEPDYEDQVDITIAKKLLASLDRVVSLAKTKLEDRRERLAQVSGDVDVLTQKYAQMAVNTKQIVQREAYKDSIVWVSKATRDRAKIRKVVAGMKKEIGELEGYKELTVRRLLMQADVQLASRLNAYVEVQKQKAGAFKTAKSIMPEILLSGSAGKGGSNTQVEQILDMLSIEKAKGLVGSK